MHAALINAPVRIAILGGSRFSCGLAAPIICTGPTTSFAQQSTSTPRAEHNSPKKNLANFSTTCINQARSYSSTTCTSRTQNSLRKGNTQSHIFTQRPTNLSSQISISFKRSFAKSVSAHAKTSKDGAATRVAAAALDWNTYFKLRASRRRYSLVSSVLASLASTAIGVQVLSAQNLDTLGAQVMGLDPFIVLGLATAACGALGWLAGPVLGNAVWGLVNRRFRSGVAIKEKEFFDRIKRYRVDPSSNSIANPVPDYYGEKIGSVQGYRQWLKDQRAYNRKKSRHIL
ncbi:mitochondrial import protein Pam17-domain-containing protein [Talaromyces proteolyticus]|uniref:Presequence translocated-associated motor subunit PAM17 n=1 Tax=Talaromyces proteolyticus TaxID=1131652 RepID=A0AAD4Q289_9EURO|nr:mitochondrial import protein Pam17-domain-containing protein [Talaromyces proteolyticus]KAH8703427.1 mitochondrial import protein Pam17-domain-containing protein [Talaromyces proteolyticus]